MGPLEGYKVLVWPTVAGVDPRPCDGATSPHNVSLPKAMPNKQLALTFNNLVVDTPIVPGSKFNELEV